MRMKAIPTVSMPTNRKCLAARFATDEVDWDCGAEGPDCGGGGSGLPSTGMGSSTAERSGAKPSIASACKPAALLRAESEAAISSSCGTFRLCTAASSDACLRETETSWWGSQPGWLMARTEGTVKRIPVAARSIVCRRFMSDSFSCLSHRCRTQFAAAGSNGSWPMTPFRSRLSHFTAGSSIGVRVGRTFLPVS